MARMILSKLSLIGTAAVAFLPACKENPKKPLNIVFIMSDDHSSQTISCYDTRYINTPNIDRLVKGGVRFTKSFVCNSISGPSRAAMLTGKHSHMNGKKDNRGGFNPDQMTFPKLLQKNGYQTALIGKYHLEGKPQGFDSWEILPGQGNYYNPDFITSKGTHREKGYVTNLITDKSIDFLEHRDKSKPFCMLVHHKAAHRIWMSELKNLKEFEDQEFPLPENFYDNYEGRIAAGKQEMSIAKDMDLVYDLKMKGINAPTHYGKIFTNNFYARMSKEQKQKWDSFYDPIIQKFKDANLSGKALAEWKYQRYMKDYLKVIRSLDTNIGRLYDYLKKADLLENTLIVYTSDQGFYMGEHGWFDKRFMYEESMSTPLVMHLPKGLEKKGDINQLVQNIDYAPTFLELAGVAIPEEIQGVSLVPLLKEDKVENWRKSLYYHYYEYPAEHAVRRHYGVRTERYKLIHFYGPNDMKRKTKIDAWELYDLEKDPTEMTNIYGKDNTEVITVELKKELKRLRSYYKQN